MRPDVTAFVVRPLYTARFVLVTSADHPLAGRPWTLEEYAAASHVLVVAWGTSDLGFADEFLAEHGLTRRIAVTVPTFEEAAALVLNSRLVTLLPESYANLPGLASGPLPIGERRLPLLHAWHPRAARDPRVRWLREVLVACVSDG